MIHLARHVALRIFPFAGVALFLILLSQPQAAAGLAAPSTGPATLAETATDTLPQPAIFRSCIACHAIETGKVSYGPNLRGVMGRKAGSLEGYAYSDALKNSDFTWDAERLDAWITNPKLVLSTTKMPFAGVKYPERRAEIIEYLSSLK